MSDVVIKVENLSKEYRLGTISHGTLYSDLQSWWARIRGKEDPNSIISHQANVSTANPHILALNDVSFEVKRGDVLGIIGRNGAGKSTLLKILSRITAPTKGVAKINGRVASLLEVGTGFHPELTGRENIILNGAILGMSKAEIIRRLDEIVAFSEIEKFLDTPVKRYSSGMYVKLAFAVAAHLEPEILIVDEVLAVGDAQFQRKCLGKMGEVARGGRTVLFVSHNLAAVQQLCQKGIVLSKGELIYSDSAMNAVDKYIDMLDRTLEIGEDGFVNLEQARDKVHKAKVFKKIRILDKNNTPCQIFPMLSPIKLEVEMENTGQYPDADYCIAILTPVGQWVTSFATWMYSKEKNRFPTKMILEIPSIKMSPGLFRVYLSATQHTAGVYIDKIENASSFHIEPVDIFNSGKAFTSDCGIMVPEGDFRLQ